MGHRVGWSGMGYTRVCFVVRFWESGFGGLELDDGVGALLVCMYEVGGIDRWE